MAQSHPRWTLSDQSRGSEIAGVFTDGLSNDTGGATTHPRIQRAIR